MFWWEIKIQAIYVMLVPFKNKKGSRNRICSWHYNNIYLLNVQNDIFYKLFKG